MATSQRISQSFGKKTRTQDASFLNSASLFIRAESRIETGDFGNWIDGGTGETGGVEMVRKHKISGAREIKKRFFLCLEI